MDFNEIPIGLGMALAQRPEAIRKFALLSENQKQEIINGTHFIHTKTEMREYVDKMISSY